jgi:PAT family beta-lactamase induction signal transducer AmpG
MGYRIGLLCAGGGALYLSLLWGWPWMLRALAFCLALGSCLIKYAPEPYKSKAIFEKKQQQFLQYQSSFQWLWKEMLQKPYHSFLQNPQWRLILLSLFAFKVGDELIKCVEGPFYLNLGFTKADIAATSKLWGMGATLLGALLGGFFLKTKDSFLAVIQTGLIHACSLLGYWILNLTGKSLFMLYITVALENITGGLAMTAFIAFLWKICDKQHAAVQYTLLWSIFSIKGNILGFLGGSLATYWSWDSFFLFTCLLSILFSIISLSLRPVWQNPPTSAIA